jgi:predicted Holliday junction resolvase-like endonuclease
MKVDFVSIIIVVMVIVVVVYFIVYFIFLVQARASQRRIENKAMSMFKQIQDMIDDRKRREQSHS